MAAVGADALQGVIGGIRPQPGHRAEAEKQAGEQVSGPGFAGFLEFLLAPATKSLPATAEGTQKPPTAPSSAHEASAGPGAPGIHTGTGAVAAALWAGEAPLVVPDGRPGQPLSLPQDGAVPPAVADARQGPAPALAGALAVANPGAPRGPGATPWAPAAPEPAGAPTAQAPTAGWGNPMVAADVTGKTGEPAAAMPLDAPEGPVPTSSTATRGDRPILASGPQASGPPMPHGRQVPGAQPAAVDSGAELQARPPTVAEPLQAADTTTGPDPGPTGEGAPRNTSVEAAAEPDAASAGRPDRAGGASPPEQPLIRADATGDSVTTGPHAPATTANTPAAAPAAAGQPAPAAGSTAVAAGPAGAPAAHGPAPAVQAVSGQAGPAVARPAAQQVAGRIAALPRGEGGVQRLTLQLEPEHLGKVSVRIAASAERLEVVLQAESPAAAQALREGQQDLMRALGGRAEGRLVHIEVRIAEPAAPERQTPESAQDDRSRSRDEQRRGDQQERRQDRSDRQEA